MPIYKQTVCFERDFKIQARDAAEANEKLGDLIRQAEWDANLRTLDYYDFEDEPVQCPKCKGKCTIGDDQQDCDRCDGAGSVPFSASLEKSTDGLKEN